MLRVAEALNSKGEGVMAESVAAETTSRLHAIDELVLKVADDLSEDELNWRPSQEAPSIAFHLWHIARWSDRNQVTIPRMAVDLANRFATQERWLSAGVARDWGLDPARLGRGQSGIGMSDSDADQFRPPTKEALVDYLRQSLADVEQVYAAIDDRLAVQPSTVPEDNGATLGGAMLSHLTHVCRHLGMIEALRGVHGQRGSATA